MSDKIIIASDSFKGSASSIAVGQAMAKGVKAILPQAQVDVFAVADGGEGTVDVFAQNVVGQLCQVTVLSPDGREISANYFISQGRHFAVIEAAQASGLTRVNPEERHILQLSSYGTGQLIKHALDQGVKSIYIGLGGTATNDMGVGAAAALGAIFLDRTGQPLAPLPASFSEIAEIDLSAMDNRLEEVEFTLLTDVDSPLCGPNGASQVFGPQKGASPEEIVYLERHLANLADLIDRDYGLNLKEIPSGGAAGGMGAGLHFFLKGSLKSGIETLLELVGFDDALQGTSLILTGEGRLDGQSLSGKVPIGIAKAAKRQGIPVVALVGSSSRNLTAVYRAGITAVFPIPIGPMTLEQSMADCLDLINFTSQNVLRVYESLKKKD